MISALANMMVIAYDDISAFGLITYIFLNIVQQLVNEIKFFGWVFGPYLLSFWVMFEFWSLDQVK